MPLEHPGYAPLGLPVATPQQVVTGPPPLSQEVQPPPSHLQEPPPWQALQQPLSQAVQAPPQTETCSLVSQTRTQCQMATAHRDLQPIECQPPALGP